MASFFSHPAIPLIVSNTKRGFSRSLLTYGVLLTLLPDADVLAFKFGIPYESQWGHRGFTHSITFAFFVSLLSLPLSSFFKASKKTTFFFSFISLISHSVLDALTNGGLGVAFFWPMDHARYFFPFHPIAVSPIGVRGFLGLRGLKVLGSEILWIWLPLILLSLIVRKAFTRKE